MKSLLELKKYGLDPLQDTNELKSSEPTALGLKACHYYSVILLPYVFSLLLERYLSEDVAVLLIEKVDVVTVDVVVPGRRYYSECKQLLASNFNIDKLFLNTAALLGVTRLPYDFLCAVLVSSLLSLLNY